jgi:2-amino-4-hydroxy-6-hydroxymethyldihydropteridine diphosphokinase
MSKIFLSLGTNLGHQVNNLIQATEMIKKRIGAVIKCSSVYKTEPWGFKSDNYFLNQVLIVLTKKLPENVLKEIKAIEAEMGRLRSSNVYESRIIDIDILFYEDIILDNINLTIPHPLLQERLFMLIPLFEIAPEFIHPVIKENICALAKSCKDKGTVEIYNNANDTEINLIHEI